MEVLWEIVLILTIAGTLSQLLNLFITSVSAEK